MWLCCSSDLVILIRETLLFLESQAILSGEGSGQGDVRLWPDHEIGSPVSTPWQLCCNIRQAARFDDFLFWLPTIPCLFHAQSYSRKNVRQFMGKQNKTKTNKKGNLNIEAKGKTSHQHKTFSRNKIKLMHTIIIYTPAYEEARAIIVTSWSQLFYFPDRYNCRCFPLFNSCGACYTVGAQ